MGMFFLAGIYDKFIEGNRQFKSCGIKLEGGGSRLEGWVKDTLTEQMYKLTIEPIKREDYDHGEEMGIVSAISENRKEVACGTKKNKKAGKGRDIKGM